MRASGAICAAVLVVLAAAATIATAGIGDLVTSGDNGVRGNASQAPIGTLSATPRAPQGDAGGDGEVLNERNIGGEGTAPENEEGNVAGVGGAGSAPGSAPSGGSGAGTLPFTGFLAIPVLLVGAAMLMGGVALRRRATAPNSA